MLTGGGLALAGELKHDLGKRVFLDMKLFDIGATVEAAVRGLAQYDLDFLTVHGDPQVVRAAAEGKGDRMKILAVTVLTSLNRADLDANLIKAGDLHADHGGAGRAGAGGRGGWGHRQPARGGGDPGPAAGARQADRDAGHKAGWRGRWAIRSGSRRPTQALADGADHIVVGRPIWAAADPAAAARAVLAEMAG